MRQKIAVFLLFFLIVAQPVLARTPADTYLAEQWYLDQIDAPGAWNITVGNRDVVIAVVDSGVDIDHPDLEDKIWTNAGETADDVIDNDRNGYVDDVHGWDFIGNDNDPRAGTENGIYDDAMNHGTIVAGIIAAKTDNDRGVAGLNWRARLMPVRILDGVGVGETKDAIKAVRYAVKNGADVINMSFTGFSYDEKFERAIREAYEAGVLVVAATGNESGGGVNLNETVIYPACFRGLDDDWVLGVAASDKDDAHADFSNYGSDCTDISAPGIDIFGALNYKSGDPIFGEPYGGYYDGTSVASPMVSAAAALLRGAYPDITPAEIKTTLQLSVDPLNVRGTTYAGQMGAGRLNVAGALVIALKLAVIAAGGSQLEADEVGARLMMTIEESFVSE